MTLTLPESAQDGRPHHVAAIFDGQTVTVYVDGERQ